MSDTMTPTPGQRLDAKLTPFIRRRQELATQIARDREELDRLASRLSDAEEEHAALDTAMLTAARELAGEDGFFASLLGGEAMATVNAEAPEAEPDVAAEPELEPVSEPEAVAEMETPAEPEPVAAPEAAAEPDDGVQMTTVPTIHLDPEQEPEPAADPTLEATAEPDSESPEQRAVRELSAMLGTIRSATAGGNDADRDAAASAAADRIRDRLADDAAA